MIAAAALILGLALLMHCMIFHPPALQSTLFPGESREKTGNFYTHFLQHLLGREIPGLEPPAATGAGGDVRGILCRAVNFLTGIDPLNYCSILAFEFAPGSEISLPVVLPPPSKEDGDTNEPGLSSPEAAPWGDALFPFAAADCDEKTIFIYHTHGSEAFTAGAGKSALAKRNIVAAGKELARLLKENYGLQVMHHREVYDLPRRSAYSKARPAIKKIIKENSEIKMVIDLHRDGVPRAKTTLSLEGKDLARLLLVVGSHNPDYQSNLALTLRLQNELEAVLPSLSRGLYQRDFTYNQDLHPSALLIELGGHENSMEEAMLSLPYLAEALARTYYISFMQD